MKPEKNVAFKDFLFFFIVTKIVIEITGIMQRKQSIAIAARTFANSTVQV